MDKVDRARSGCVTIPTNNTSFRTVDNPTEFPIRCASCKPKTHSLDMRSMTMDNRVVDVVAAPLVVLLLVVKENEEEEEDGTKEL